MNLNLVPWTSFFLLILAAAPQITAQQTTSPPGPLRSPIIIRKICTAGAVICGAVADDAVIYDLEQDPNSHVLYVTWGTYPPSQPWKVHFKGDSPCGGVKDFASDGERYCKVDFKNFSLKVYKYTAYFDQYPSTDPKIIHSAASGFGHRRRRNNR